VAAAGFLLCRLEEHGEFSGKITFLNGFEHAETDGHVAIVATGVHGLTRFRTKALRLWVMVAIVRFLDEQSVDVNTETDQWSFAAFEDGDHAGGATFHLRE